ncbi:clathrin heavy chain linker domain-containing protein 1-like [Montipora foliosa]|uniref:clathrin heavy chain linker domain-containing protein 1-like n=1 Tax=Montipora foliosa TaxID=591990 RepID=UPI0035F16684
MSLDSAVNLEDFLDRELLQLSTDKDTTKQDRYCIHKLCFEYVIDLHSIYKDLLSRIKAEYDECIEAIKTGQKEAVYLSGKLAATLMEPETLRNFKQRGDELELKIALLKLRKQGMLSQKLNVSCRNSVNSSLAGPKLSWNQTHNSSRTIFLPCFTVEQLTDTAFLIKKLQDLQSRVTQLKLENETKFASKPLKGQLFKRLLEKEAVKETLLSKREKLKMAIMSVKFSLTVNDERRRKGSTTEGGFMGRVTDVAIAYRETEETMKKADEMFPETVGSTGPNQPSSLIGDDDDPTKDREAEFILQCIENFFELFEAGKVDEAALIAAQSPKGVLRTMETINMMKEYDATHKDSSVTVAYWEALIPTVATGCMKPSVWETIECVKCVLEKGRSDLLTHWIAQDLLSLSEEAGKLILDACHCLDRCSCGLIGLAEAVFQNVGAYKEVLLCFFRQRRYHTAMEYYKSKNNLTRKDLLLALQKVPFANSILSLCNDLIDDGILSDQEVADFLSHVLVNHACRLASITANQ